MNVSPHMRHFMYVTMGELPGAPHQDDGIWPYVWGGGGLSVVMKSGLVLSDGVWVSESESELDGEAAPSGSRPYRFGPIWWCLL